MIGVIVLLTLFTLPAFPSGFKWCAATSAHQIEGNNNASDWWLWELFPDHIRNGDFSGMAADHWNRLEEDTALLKSLNVTDYRLGIEWAKIEPKKGHWDFSALAHYLEELLLLRAHNIRPIITLNHFTIPQWFLDQGGWASPQAPELFERYTRVIYETFGDLATDWITLNEPLGYLAGGYLLGITPPGLKDIYKAIPPFVGMIRAHAAAYHAIHRLSERYGWKARVGVAHHFKVYEAYNSINPTDRIGAILIDDLANVSFPRALWEGRLRLLLPGLLNIDIAVPEAAKTQDFLGVNYYERKLVKFNSESPIFYDLVTREGAPVSDLGWEIYPEGLGKIALWLSSAYPGLPIFVTENGLDDASDSKRVKFIRDHLSVIKAAIDQGIHIEGYCHWSLMDNFEWVEGFTPRFGLFEVDYNTFERRPRPSAQVFAEIAGTNGAGL